MTLLKWKGLSVGGRRHDSWTRFDGCACIWVMNLIMKDSHYFERKIEIERETQLLHILDKLFFNGPINIVESVGGSPPIVYH